MSAKLSDSGADWDAYEQASSSDSRQDRPRCRQCRQPITDDNWRGGPVVGYLCSRCDERNRHYAEQEQPYGHA